MLRTRLYFEYVVFTFAEAHSGKLRNRKVGRGALHAERSSTVRSCGLHGRENAGMSSENKVRILMAEYPKMCIRDRLMGLPLNRALWDEDGLMYDVIAGTFLVVGLGEEDFVSLSPEPVSYTHLR